MVGNLMVRNFDSWPSPMLDVNSGIWLAHFFQLQTRLERAGLHLWFSACFQPCSTESWTENHGIHGTLDGFETFWDILRHFETWNPTCWSWLSRPGMTSLHWQHRGSVWKKWTCGYVATAHPKIAMVWGCLTLSSGKAMGVSRSVCRTLALETSWNPIAAACCSHVDPEARQIPSQAWFMQPMFTWKPLICIPVLWFREHLNP